MSSPMSEATRRAAVEAYVAFVRMRATHTSGSTTRAEIAAQEARWQAENGSLNFERWACAMLANADITSRLEADLGIVPTAPSACTTREPARPTSTPTPDDDDGEISVTVVDLDGDASTAANLSVGVDTDVS